MFELRFRGRLCVPSHDALRDMARHDVPPSLVECIVIEGEEYANGLSAKGEAGMALRKGGYIIFVKLVPSLSLALDEEVWVIKHVGKRRMDR
ncbi:MAG: hypothetical protein HZB92_04950 [Euryarchaeota archaeon]|nr:hypothetical protein [Euryarchaeota archaeon]